jgi:hypothetical protein
MTALSTAAMISSAAAQRLPGTLLVCEYNANSVVDVLAGGDLSDAPRFATGLARPISICVGPNDDIFVAEMRGNSVQKITAGGDFTATSRFATGILRPTGLACTSTKIYVVEWAGGRVFDVTAGGDFSAASPFATVITANEAGTDLVANYSSLKVDDDGKLWLGAGTGVWNISAGGTFADSDRYATATAFGGVAFGMPAGFGFIDGTLYVGIFGGGVVPVTMGAVLDTTTPYARVPPYLSGFASAHERSFVVTQESTPKFSVFEVTGGGDFTAATPLATGLGTNYFGIMYYNACGDGVLQTAFGEDCDDGGGSRASRARKASAPRGVSASTSARTAMARPPSVKRRSSRPATFATVSG